MKRFLSMLLCAALTLMLLPAVFQTASAASLTIFNIRLNEPVASYTPDFSPEFNTNATVYSNVTWQENSPGFSAKLNSSDEFKAGLAYKVEIWVNIGDDCYLATDAGGDLAAAITVNGKAISSLKINGRNSQGKINQVTITCEYDPLSGMVISNALVKGIPTPVEGNMPIYSFTLGNTNAYYFYHTEPVVWWDLTADRQMDSGDTFVKGHKYQLCIWLRANREGGFTFKTDSSGNPQVNVTLNSWAPDSVTKAYEQEGREVIDIRYNFPACQAAHICAPKLVAEQAPTCLMPGFKAYYKCSCGKCFEDAAGKKPITDMDGYGILSALGHKEGDWSYNGTHHYKKCTTCKEVIPGTNAAHTGGTATCSQKGKCTACGYAYLETNENHTPDTGKWVARAEKYHFHACKDCGAHCDIADHKPGPAATESAPQTCTVCGYILAPTKKHKHDLTRVPQTPANCTQGGNIEYYFCTGCNDCFTDAEGQNKIPGTMSVQVDPLGHTASDTWTYDGQYHWRTCKTCAAVLDKTKMLHDDQGGDNACDTCGHTVGSEAPQGTAPAGTTAPQGTAPADTTAPQTADKPESPDKGISWLLILPVVLVCFGAAITAAVIIMKKQQGGKQ